MTYTYDEILDKLLADKKTIFIELYLKKFGEHYVLISYPENYKDCYECLLYKLFTISEVKIRRFDNLLVQFHSESSLELLKAFAEKFGFEIYDNVKLHKLEFTGFVGDNIYNHAPVTLMGMAFGSTYRKYFKEDNCLFGYSF
ncbi:MAG: hypothetical protein IJ228_03940 [Succinivibrio sp.]|nr:hypothetical protein [Succinivibrio sp.]